MTRLCQEHAASLESHSHDVIPPMQMWGVVLAILSVLLTLRVNKKHRQDTGVSAPSDRQLAYIRRNARRRGISKAQAYEEWLLRQQNFHDVDKATSVRSATSPLHSHNSTYTMVAVEDGEPKSVRANSKSSGFKWVVIAAAGLVFLIFILSLRDNHEARVWRDELPNTSSALHPTLASLPGSLEKNRTLAPSIYLPTTKFPTIVTIPAARHTLPSQHTLAPVDLHSNLKLRKIKRHNNDLPTDPLSEVSALEKNLLEEEMPTAVASTQPESTCYFACENVGAKTHYVQGYTRANGTFVHGYFRGGHR